MSECRRNDRKARASAWLLAPFLAACFGVGCEPLPEAKYDAATRKLSKAERAVLRKEVTLQASEARAREAQERVERDRKALIDARQELANAEGRLGELATDEVLFRAIQRRLLDDAALRESAISVEVREGRVTLSGRVSDAKLRVRAVESVAGARGVKGVDDRIQVSRPARSS